MISNAQWQKIINEINKILGVDDISTAPDKLMKILQNRTERERVFEEMLELFAHDLSFDWFSTYFQENLANSKKGQVFTPPHTAELMSELVGLFGNGNTKGRTGDFCAGTGALIIGNWNLARKKDDYIPSDYIYLCVELSDRMIPFLIFNLAVRGITGFVIHGDMMKRESKGAFLILNEENKSGNFSIVNSLPYFKATEQMLGFKFVEEKYPHQFEFKIKGTFRPVIII